MAIKKEDRNGMFIEISDHDCVPVPRPDDAFRPSSNRGASQMLQLAVLHHKYI
jgi:hypothetical protein